MALPAFFDTTRRWGALTLYGGLQSGQSTVDTSYVSVSDQFEGGSAPERVTIAVTSTGINKTRGIAGLSLSFGSAVLSTDVSVGRVTVVSTGLGFAI